MLLKWWVRPLLLLTHWHFKFCVEGLHPSLNAERRWEKLKCKSSVLKSLLHIVLPSVSQCASPVFPASSSLHPAVALELPVRGIMGNDYVLPSVLSMRILVACLYFFSPPFLTIPSISPHLLLLKGFLWGFLGCLQCSRIVHSLCEANRRRKHL